ncbi:MAG: trimethylamine methyltransferase family protein [Desulfobacterales bacterium]|nr:trimethylamine methyltransferase family protein [Desulfobacterales bacterium]
MQAQFSVLSEEEVRKIHSLSLEVLKEVGAKFTSKKALKILEDSGALVDWDNCIARIPEDMVNESLKTASKFYTLGARNRVNDFALPSQHTGYILDGMATFMKDFKTGERREAIEKDLADSFKICEELDLCKLVWPNVTVHDFPVNSTCIRTFLSSFKYISKHIQDELHHPSEVPFLIEGLTAILGSEDAIKERKICSVTYCTVPPLVHEDHMTDAYLELVQYHIPILSLPMCACGSTGPASLYSNIAVSNAEALSSLVLFQMAEPGTPQIFGFAVGNTDFSRGSFLTGSPEMALMNSALCQMAKHYGIPTTQSACATDACDAGPQAVIEKMVTNLPAVLNGVDMIVGFGGLETSNIVALDQIVVDHEIAQLCKRIKDGVDVCDEKKYFEDVKKAEPGGHFLMSPGTIKACRSDEFMVPDLSVRLPYENWLELGKPDIYDRARDKVSDILSAPRKNPLTDDVIGTLDEIMIKADKEL